MKFRYKVMIVNLLLLSAALGVTGYLMIRRNVRFSKESQLSAAVMENRLVQTSVEYEILQLLNGSGYQSESLPEIGEQVYSSLSAGNLTFFIYRGEQQVYRSSRGAGVVPESLYTDMQMGDKRYVIERGEAGSYLYVCSYAVVDGDAIAVVTKHDMTETYRQMDGQIAYFRLLMAAVLLVVTLALSFICRYLTGPLEQLNAVTDEMANGNYAVRAKIRAGDELGLLAEKFNRMALAIEEHVRQLSDMIHRRDQFVADFTHEIKTPMTSIIGYADTMRSMELPREDELMALNYIFSEGKRLEALSQKLFDLLYLREHEPEKTVVHTADLEQEIRRITEPPLAEKQIRLTGGLAPAQLLGDQELLATALFNVIDNAKKASADGAVIELTGRFLAEGYEIAVRDYGVGMTEEEAAHMCDEFYMADKSRARDAGGAGIGMALVALIAKKHGAGLSVESGKGKGTCIRICFAGVEPESGEAE